MDATATIAAAATSAYAAEIVARVYAGQHSTDLDAASTAMTVGLAAVMLGDPDDDPRPHAAETSCRGHLEQAAATLDGLPAAQRPAGLLGARARLADALRASRGLPDE